MIEEKKLLFEVTEGVGIITLNRPEKMNAVTDDMQIDLLYLVADIIKDDKVRAVILTGAGRAFCGGTDLDRLSAGRAESEARQRRREAVPMPGTVLPDWTFTRIPKPTIAAVNGAAVGMGAEWTVQCDFRIASEDARFGWVFSQRGLVPDTGAGPYLLPMIVGLSRALELMYSGEIIDAREAERIGLVSKVVPPVELIPAAMELARKVSKGAPLSNKGIKELTYSALEMPPNAHRVDTRRRFNEALETEDFREGISAFREKRPPQWKGR